MKRLQRSALSDMRQCSSYLPLKAEEIYDLAKSFQKKGRLSAKDAVHLACASYIGADVFLTCDDKLIKQAKRLKLEMEVMNPPVPP